MSATTIRISPWRLAKSDDFVHHGGGRIISEPAGIDCRFAATVPTTRPPKVRGSCEARFPRGSKVRLIPSFDESSAAVEWDARRVPRINWFGCTEADPCEVMLDRSRIELRVGFKLRVLSYSVQNVPAGLGHVQQVEVGAGREAIYCGRARAGRDEVCENSEYYGQAVRLNLISDQQGGGVERLSRCRPVADPLPWTGGGTCSTLIDAPDIVITVFWKGREEGPEGGR